MEIVQFFYQLSIGERKLCERMLCGCAWDTVCSTLRRTDSFHQPVVGCSSSSSLTRSLALAVTPCLPECRRVLLTCLHLATYFITFFTASQPVVFYSSIDPPARDYLCSYKSCCKVSSDMMTSLCQVGSLLLLFFFSTVTL